MIRDFKRAIDEKVDGVALIAFGYNAAPILCTLDVGGPETEIVHLVSITHLTFNRNIPLAREIEAYQRHRNKKLKQQQGRFS
jgi:hypothetical protein